MTQKGKSYISQMINQSASFVPRLGFSSDEITLALDMNQSSSSFGFSTERRLSVS